MTGEGCLRTSILEMLFQENYMPWFKKTQKNQEGFAPLSSSPKSEELFGNGSPNVIYCCCCCKIKHGRDSLTRGLWNFKWKKKISDKLYTWDGDTLNNIICISRALYFTGIWDWIWLPHWKPSKSFIFFVKAALINIICIYVRNYVGWQFLRLMINGDWTKNTGCQLWYI